MSTPGQPVRGRPFEPLPAVDRQAWTHLVPGRRAWPSAPVLTGALALVVAALAAAWTNRLHSTDAADRQRLVKLAQPAPQSSPRPAPRATALADDQWLLAALPAATVGAERVAALLALAATNGVTVDSVRQAAPLPLAAGQAALPAERVVLQIRASGPYLGLRQWVAQALQHDDALLLERLRLARPLASSTALSAELGWALLQGATGSAP